MDTPKRCLVLHPHGIQYSVEPSYCVICRHVKPDDMSSVITHPKKRCRFPLRRAIQAEAVRNGLANLNSAISGNSGCAAKFEAQQRPEKEGIKTTCDYSWRRNRRSMEMKNSGITGCHSANQRSAALRGLRKMSGVSAPRCSAASMASRTRSWWGDRRQAGSAAGASPARR